VVVRFGLRARRRTLLSPPRRSLSCGCHTDQGESEENARWPYDDIKRVSEFLNKLPATIRPNVIKAIGVFYTANVALDIRQAQAVILEELYSKDMAVAARAFAFLAAAIDHVLLRVSL
jgi:hypothetical protein